MTGLATKELLSFVGQNLEIINGNRREGYPLQCDGRGFFVVVERKPGGDQDVGTPCRSRVRYTLKEDDISRIYLNMRGQLLSTIKIPSGHPAEDMKKTEAATWQPRFVGEV